MGFMPHDSPLGLFTFGAEDDQADTFSQPRGPDTDRPARRTCKSVDRIGGKPENSPTFMLKSCFFIAALLATDSSSPGGNQQRRAGTADAATLAGGLYR